MYEFLKKICIERGTTVTELCKQVTGNSGNLATWKKGYMRSDYLKKAAEILNVSVDYLLGRTEDSNAANDKGKDKRAVKVLDEKNSDFDCGDFFNNKAVSKAYDRLSEREKLQVMMYILDVAEKSETPNGVVKIIEKASPDSTEEA